jgi:hypothetical protein
LPLSIYISPTWARPSLVCSFRSFRKLSDLPNKVLKGSYIHQTRALTESNNQESKLF